MPDILSLSTPLGYLGLEVHSDSLIRVYLPQSHQIPVKNLAKNVKHSIQNHIDALSYYFKRHQSIDKRLVVIPSGTPFQKKVWLALLDIPYGHTTTYGSLANQLKTSPRAIGNACRKNPLPLFIPCHRVVARNNLGGYAGATQGKNLDIKQWLLNHEQQ